MKRLVVFAHYDAQDEIKRFIVHNLQALHETCERVVFVSNAQLPPAELEKIRPFCAEILLRENVGFDFGMWRQALEHIDFEAWDELILTNSSVFGPVLPLGPVLEHMAQEPCDAWGMTDNIEFAWHLQSYFLAFRRPVLTSPLFRQFWASVLPLRDKEQVIRTYELGLSRLLLDYGFRLQAFAPTQSLEIPGSSKLFNALGQSLWARMRSRRVNPTCGYPLPLLRAGMPFVKAEVLRDNPLGADVGPVLEAMEQAGYDMSLVEFDRKTKRGAAPPPRFERVARRA